MTNGWGCWASPICSKYSTGRAGIRGPENYCRVLKAASIALAPTGENHFYLTVPDADKQFLKFYRFDAKAEGVEEIDFSQQVREVRNSAYHEKFFTWPAQPDAHLLIVHPTNLLTSHLPVCQQTFFGKKRHRLLAYPTRRN